MKIFNIFIAVVVMMMSSVSFGQSSSAVAFTLQGASANIAAQAREQGADYDVTRINCETDLNITPTGNQ